MELPNESTSSGLSELSPSEEVKPISSKSETMECSENVEPNLPTSKSMVKKKRTGLVYHESMKLHKCEWDPNYPECPNRIDFIMTRLEELDLVEKCKNFEIRDFELEYILLVHTEKHVNTLEQICKTPKSHQEEARKYDAIYFNKDSYQCALKAVNATLTLVSEIVFGEVQNGLAVIRPPGHHAQKENYNGYCFFNNVCIATEYLLKHGFEKILIVDFDVHHGQGTQRKYYDNKNVLYFSIHRYEHGTFWPCLEESNFNFIGEGLGLGYNINVPLNRTKCTDTDYMSIITHILLPVAYEFKPDFILISGGYDACMGCPEGEMEVTPAFYGHLVMLLSGLAEGRMAVLLEGGYFLPSLSEGVAMTLRGLLDMNPAILKAMDIVSPEVIEVINNLKLLLRDNWACFGAIEFFDGNEIDTEFLHRVKIKKFKGEELQPPFEISECYPKQLQYVQYQESINLLKEEYGLPVQHRICHYSSNNDFFKDYENRIEIPENNRDTYADLVNVVQNQIMEYPSTGLYTYPSTVHVANLFTCPKKAFIETFKMKKIVLVNFSSDVVLKLQEDPKVLEFNFNNNQTLFKKFLYKFDATEFTDADYFHFLFKLILPISYSFAPEAVVVIINPDDLKKFENFSHFVLLLKPLAGGRMLLIMDESKATLKTFDGLLGEPLPMSDTILKPFTQTILHDAISALRESWKILEVEKPCYSQVIFEDE